MPGTKLLKTLEETGNLLAQISEYLPNNSVNSKELSARKKQLKSDLREMEDDTEAKQFMKKYKDLKENANILDKANMSGLRQLLKNSHDAAEKELKETKSTTEKCLKLSAQFFDKIFQTKLSEITSWLPLVQEGLVQLEDKYSKAIDELTKKLEDIPEDIDKNMIISQASIELNGVLLSLRKVTTEYISSKLKQLDDTKKPVEQFPCCMAFIKILMGIAGISSEEDPPSRERAYVKIFGTGYLSKAVYNATRELYTESKKPRVNK